MKPKKSCIAFGCLNTEQNPNLSFHRLPKEEESSMDRVDGVAWESHRDIDRSYYSDSYSDDSPILSHRYERRYAPYIREGKEEKERRSTLSVLAKFFLFCSAMIMFCVLMYIPVYNKANYQMPKGIVQGWSIHTNRDTKLYVQPDNVTTIHEPKHVCDKRTDKNKLFLLIVVCSSTVNFDKRIAIRETWASYKNYVQSFIVFKKVTDRYKSYNYNKDLYPNEHEKLVSNTTSTEIINVTSEEKRIKRDINGFSGLLPELAKVLKSNLNTVTEPELKEESRFDNVEDEPLLPEFDMNEVMDDKNTETYDYNYESNIMKIPPKGEENDLEDWNKENSDLEKILSLLKTKQNLNSEMKTESDKFNTESVHEKTSIRLSENDFKVVFLLGVPPKDNSSKIQSKIEEEVKKYGDIIQEGFIDSYNNLTLKSIMMLKWVTNRCNDSVRYILKTDDDMFINLPNLMLNLRNRSTHFDKNHTKNEKEYLLIGDLINGARPVMDPSNKWYSPRYMYNARIYPRYVSGTGYVLSTPTARSLFEAALRTRYFHLEDIYITGMCSLRASPRILPRDDPAFSYRAVATDAACWAHSHTAAHHLSPNRTRNVQVALTREAVVDRCERKRLTEVRRERLRPKTTSKKKLTKVPVNTSNNYQRMLEVG